MSISSVNTNYCNSLANSAVSAAKTTGTAEKDEKGAKAGNTEAAARTDSFVRGAGSKRADDTVPKRLTADQMREIQDQQSAAFQKMLSSMLNTQADKARLAKKGISADLFKNITVTPEQQAAAQQAISEDGEWGVNAVAARIMDMAVAVSGGDSSKISVMREAVEKGFKQAGVQWGEKLPSITQKTHDEIDKRFDYWEENGSLDGYEYKTAEKEEE